MDHPWEHWLWFRKNQFEWPCEDHVFATKGQHCGHFQEKGLEDLARKVNFGMEHPLAHQLRFRQRKESKTRGLQLCPVFHFTTQWIRNPRYGKNIITLLPKHGPHIVLKMGSSWILINVPRDAPCQISLCWLNPVAPFPRNGHNVALLWPKHGPYMVLKMGSSWTSISVPRDVPCQILHCWVYPVVPFPKNGKNMALLWPKHGPHMVLHPKSESLVWGEHYKPLPQSNLPVGVALLWLRSLLLSLLNSTS